MHKNITNPTLTPDDKLMAAIKDCKKALNNLAAGESDDQVAELQRLVDTAGRRRAPPTTPLPRVASQQTPNAAAAVPRVARQHASAGDRRPAHRRAVTSRAWNLLVL